MCESFCTGFQQLSVSLTLRTVWTMQVTVYLYVCTWPTILWRRRCEASKIVSASNTTSTSSSPTLTTTDTSNNRSMCTVLVLLCKLITIDDRYEYLDNFLRFYTVYIFVVLSVAFGLFDSICNRVHSINQFNDCLMSIDLVQHMSYTDWRITIIIGLVLL